MQQEIVPTSPKYKGADKKAIKKQIIKAKISIFEFFLLVVFCVLGGYLSFFFFHNYLGQVAALPQEIIYLQKERQETISTSEALVKIEPSIVNIFSKKTTDDYLPQEAISSGIVLTSDGWIAAVLPPATYSADELVVISNDNTIREIQDLIYDEYSTIYFLRASGNNNLKAVQFVDTEQLTMGDNVLAVFNSLFSGQRVVLTNLENLLFKDENNYTTNAYPYNYLIADNLRKEYFGSVLINNAGDVIGLNLLDNRVLPHAYFSVVMPQIISQQQISRVSLDLEYTDLSRAVNSTEKKGALVGTSRDLSLQNNDIILKIDNIEIDKYHNLTDILQEYKPGDQAVFTIKRLDKEQEIGIEL